MPAIQRYTMNARSFVALSVHRRSTWLRDTAVLVSPEGTAGARDDPPAWIIGQEARQLMGGLLSRLGVVAEAHSIRRMCGSNESRLGQQSEQVFLPPTQG